MNYSSIDKIVFWFALIDILFIPYASFIAVGFSSLVLPFWIIYRFKELIRNKDFIFFIPIFVLISFSSILGYLLYGSSTNISRGIQLILIFMYYFLFNYGINIITKKQLKTLILVFFIMMLIFCFIYNYDKNTYYSIARIWNTRGIDALYSNYNITLSGYRFSHTWSDPNNAAYMICILLSYIYCNYRLDFFQKILLFSITIFVLFSSMSRGGLIAFILTLMVFIICKIINTKKIYIKTKIKYVDIFKFVVVIVMLIMSIYFFNRFQKSYIFSNSINRMSNTSDSRLEIWSYILKNRNIASYFLLGTGGDFFINGENIKPHNGHLYLIMGYGMITYIYYMYLVFFKLIKRNVYYQLWKIPFFIGFTINVMIGDVKIAAIIMLILASEKILKENEQ